MKYYLELVYKLNKRNGICIFFDIITLALGLVIGVIFLAEANTQVVDRKCNYNLLNKSQYLIYEPDSGADKIQNSDLVEIQNRNTGIAEILVENQLNDEILKHNNNFCMGISVIGVSDNFMSFFRPGAIKGNLLSQKNEVLIGENVANQYGIEVGDRVEIDIYTFSVCGIIQVANYKNSVICFNSRFEDVQYMDCRYYVKADDEGRKAFDYELKQKGYAKEINYVQVKNFGQKVFELKRSGDSYECYVPEEMLQKETEEFKSGWKPSVIISIVSLCYALLNIMNVERFFAMQQKKFIAVMQALGASSRKMVLAKVFYSLFISFAAGILAVLMTSALQRTTFRYLIEMNIDIRLILGVVIITQIIYALFCYVLYYAMYKRSVVSILSDG